MIDKLMRAECIFPAPMISEKERQERLERFRLSIWANGCVIDKEWRVHNPVFDAKGEKSTTKFQIRPAKSDEVDFILQRILE